MVDTRSFSEAAALCHVSQSGLSKHIAAIEAELGVELIRRPGNPPVLTSAGASFAHDARVIMNEYKAAISRVMAIKHEKDQQAILGYWLPAGRSFMRELHIWRKRNSIPFEIKPISLSLSEIETSLLDHSIDAALTIVLDDELDSQCNSVLLKEERLLLAVNKQHPLARFDTVKLVDLEGETMLSPSSDVMPHVREHIEEVFGTLPSYANRRRYDDVETVLLGVESGMGVAMVMEHNRSNYGDRIRFLHVQEEEETGFTIPLKLLWLKEAENSYSRMNIISSLKKAFTALAR